MSPDWKDLKVVKFLHVYSAALGLTVPDLKSNKTLAIFYTLYCVFVCAALITAAAMNISYRIATYYAFLSNTIKFLDLVVALTFVTTSICFVICSGLIKRKKIVQLENKLNVIERRMKDKFKPSVEYNVKGLLIQFITFQLLAAGLSISVMFHSGFAHEQFWINITRLQLLFVLVVILQVMSV